MALSMEDMATGVITPAILAKVQSGMMNRCYLAYAATAAGTLNANAGIQAKRVILCARVSDDPGRYVTNFAWMVMSVTTATALQDVTDAVITSSINQGNWDMMADLLVPS